MTPRASQPITSRAAERAFEALSRADARFKGTAESEADLPAWYLLTPAGAIRIRTIGIFEPFVEFVTADGQIMFVAPEAVVVTMQKLEPESDEPRFAISFAPASD